MSRCGDDVALAAASVLGGDAIVYPTETVYGLGVDATSESAIARLVALKGRDASKGISVLVTGMEAVDPLVGKPPTADALRLMERFWPGPLTIVLPAAESVPAALIGPSGGVGLRCASDPFALRLVEAAGVPITSTSANPSGQVPAASAEQARSYFGDEVGYYLDGGERTGGLASSVVEFTDSGIFLRRAGAVSVAELRKYVKVAGEGQP